IDQALIHEHTRAMHGHCEFNNSNGLLRRFCFECEAEMTKTDTACVAVRSWKDLTVLLVEDEPLVRKLHTLQLEKWGATVHSLANGQQALEHLRNTSTQYDLVLMDLHMPVKNGFDCTREMKSEFAERCRTIVALTAGGTREDQDRAFECGVDGFFLKPLKKDDLATMTASVV
ncbi:MAG: response regulator, partial [Limnobacter sp.]|nr:response regulator [Limnobacter sp.]